MGGNRGKKIMLKHKKIRDISFMPVGKGITNSKEFETAHFSHARHEMGFSGSIA